MFRDEANIRLLAERMRWARRARHMTQEQVADLTHVSQSAISLYELGRREPYVSTVKRLAVAYGVTIDWLMGISDVGGPETGGDSVDDRDESPYGPSEGVGGSVDDRDESASGAIVGADGPADDRGGPDDGNVIIDGDESAAPTLG